MIKKISNAKDLEFDQMQLRVKAFEGESMHASIYLQLMISLFNVCLYTCELALHEKYVYLAALNTFLNAFAFVYINLMLVYDLTECIFQCSPEALYEKKQSMVTSDSDFAGFQARVKKLDLASKESEGEMNEKKS